MSPQSRPPSGASDFDPTRLTVARRLRGFTKADLARSLGVTPTAVAQYERGSRPTQPVMAQMCLTLGMPREFFGAGNPMALLPASGAHFRSLRSTSARAREQVLAYGELCLELVDLIGEYVDLPDVQIPDVDLPEEITPEVITAAASATREQWQVATGAVPSVVQLLESHGIVVIRLPEGTDSRVDALSTHAGSRPLVFLSPTKDDKARSRFDAAHELGHLVLHPDTEPGSRLVEQEANAFAAEFLMPRDEIFAQLPTRIQWPAFHELKRHWGVSLRALVFRAHALGRLTDASYRRANQQLSGWGLPEPGPLGPSESPQMLGMARQLLIEHGIDFDNVLTQGRIAVEVTNAVVEAGSESRPRLQFS